MFCCLVYFSDGLQLLNFWDSDLMVSEFCRIIWNIYKMYHIIHLRLKKVPQSTTNGGFMLILNQTVASRWWRYQWITTSTSAAIKYWIILESRILISSSFQYWSTLIDYRFQFMYISTSALQLHKLPYKWLFKSFVND